MENNQFCHLHSHSAYSLLDGLCNLPDLVLRAKELNQPAIALTEHGNMHSAFNFYKECKKQGIKPIIGIETYLAKNRMQDKEEDDRQRYHFLLLAENQTGYKNLIQLSSLAYTEGFYYKPRIDNELLAQYSDGLIATSGCMASPVAQAYFENPQKAIQLINFYSDIFPDRFFLELQEHSIPELTEYNKFLIEQSKKNNLPLLATNDVHYINHGDSFNHDVLLCVQTNKKYQDKNRMRFSDNGYYLKSYDEMFQLFGEYPESLSNSVLISEMCNVNLDFDGYKIPKFQNNLDSFAELWKVAHNGLINRYKLLQIAKNPAILTRFEYEMSIIQQMNIADYFLILWDLCKYARSQNVWYNTRGSATGSIVCYALGITSLCPLEHELYFERFLNPSRVNLPDVDLDIEDVQREKIAHYLLEKYGSENVAQIATFSTMKARGTIRDVFRAMDVPLSQADIVAKSIPQIPGKVITINNVLDGESEFYSPEFNSHYQSYQKEIDIAKGLESTVRHSGIHAAGVVVTPSPVTDYAPVMRNTNGLGGIKTATQWDMKTVDEIGLLKIDLLGLTTLSAIRECSQLIQQRYNIRCRYDDIPFESFHKPLLVDKPVSKAFQLLAQGKTVGCFQLENAGLQNVLKQMKPTEFRHIVAAISLYRPGPKQFIPEYIAGLHGYKRNSKYEILEDILGKTYYSLVYQEQIISIARKIANYSAHEADYIRKAIGKRDPVLMASHKEKFINGGLENGYEKQFLEELWQDIEKFASYSFNAAHANSYATLSVKTAYLKANFPLEFMVSCINSESSKPDRQKDYLFETLRLGIKLLPPDVNYSTNEFQIENDAIRFGYSAIKYAKSTEEIIANKPYESFGDFCNKVNAKKVGKKTMCALLCSGAFDSILDRNKALQIVENYTQWQKGKFNFAETIYSQKQIEKFELEYTPIVLNKSYTFLDNYNDGDFIVLTGVVQNIDIILTKYGKKFAKFVLDNVECLMYNTDNLGTLESGQVVARGKVRHDVHGSNVVVDNVLGQGNKVKKAILL